jgi:ATP-dependent helicase/nuclease subunit B
MQVWFDLDFDGGCWPGPLGSRTAAAGEAWLGPSGLLNLLETQLGLAGPAVSDGLRAARLVPRFLSVSGFWDESAAVDPLAAARMLLDWRDLLRMGGWKGQAKQSRLAGLWKLTDGLPGAPDRIAAVTERLARRKVDVAAVHLLGDRPELSMLWQNLLKALEERGVAVTSTVEAAASQGGDLLACQAPG